MKIRWHPILYGLHWRRIAPSVTIGLEPFNEPTVLLDKQAIAASLIASHWKRKMVQRKFQRMRNDEFAFLGMVLPEKASTLDHTKIAEEVRILAI